MTAKSLVQYFRSFLIKLSMIEASLGQMELGDDVSFAIILELKDQAAPSISQTSDPAPWIPAEGQHTTAGASDKAELHMIRAVSTGIINVRLYPLECQLAVLNGVAAFFGRPRVRRED
jgi:mitotic spindle assembly checkpoint protein MAD2B